MTTQPPFLESPPVCCATPCHCCTLSTGKVEGDGGWGRCRLLEDSALWLPLSNWLMTKASICSWQAGASTPWLCWYTYLSWECRDGPGRRGCRHSARVLRRRLRLCTLGPNEVAGCYNVIRMHAHAHSAVVSAEGWACSICVTLERKMSSWDKCARNRNLDILQWK